MVSDEDVKVVSGRMRAWSEVLGALGEPDRCRALLESIDLGDADAFHGLVGGFDLFQGRTCVEISDTITKFANFGDGTPQEICEIVAHLRPPQPSNSSGRGYRLPDGTLLWLSEADWWALMDRAVSDEAWRQDNHDLLVAVGILRCHWQIVDDIRRIDITKTYSICPPTWDPRAGFKPA